MARKDIECPLCCNVLCEPVQLDCGEIVCSGCCHQWVEAASQPSCPCCYRGHPFTPASIRQAPSIITTVLDSGCVESILLPSPSRAERESRVASGFIRRLLSESPDGNTITVPPLSSWSESQSPPHQPPRLAARRSHAGTAQSAM